ncbi:Ff.00g113380.m01.CDS01 [Fusarium sp. VM40]|nr:Ff.00g113380.m01.CDS01 [Fusarium sp. VM40]
METIIKQMIDEVWFFPRGGTKVGPGGRKNPDNFKHYRKWGFTVYRTYYGEESDKYWQSLLYSLRHQTKLAFGSFEDEKDIDQDDRRRVQELFQLDVCDDPSLLGGLDVRGLREVCNAQLLKETQVIQQGCQTVRVTTRPREDQAMADYLFGFVLLADEAVLKDIERGEYIVKAVSLQWDGYTGWGWVRIPTGYLVELWTYLMWHDDRLERCLYFHGSEEDLADRVWPGDMALHNTGGCSEIRYWRHYENQDEMY